MNNQKKSVLISLSIVALLYIFLSIWKGPYFPIVKFHYWMGFIKQTKGDLHGAIKEYDSANDWDKNYFTAYVSRGSAYLDLKKHNEAILNYSTAIKLNPESAEAFAYRGRAKYEMDNLKESLEDFDKAILLNEKFGYAYFNRALLKYIKIEDFDGGCKDFQKASELGDSDAKKYLENHYCD